MNVRLFLPLLIISVISCLVVSGQKSYHLTIKSNNGIKFSQFKIYVDDGRSQKLIEVKDTQSLKVTVTGTFYSKYAMVKLTCPKPGILVDYFENRFFVKEKPAEIILKKEKEGQSPLGNYSLINAFDFKTEKDKMAEYSAKEESHRSSFVLQHDKEINDGSDSAVQNEYFKLSDLVLKKDFDYVLKNGDSYYAFVYFRRNLVNLLPPDSMLQVFNKTFPAKFKNSEEGKTLQKYWAGKIAVKLNNMPPNFSAQDINGTKVSLYSFRNKKFVLLTFWATWCGPCITEMPQIKALHDKYLQRLEIISVAYPSNYNSYLKAVKVNGMNWVNIYGNAMLINDYGGQSGIPRIYLIDKTGKIIYDKSTEENGDKDLRSLYTKLNDLILQKK